MNVKYLISKIIHKIKDKGIFVALVFAHSQAKCKKPKEPIFLPTLGQTSNETNEIYIER
jgi:hypothetical protein